MAEKLDMYKCDDCGMIIQVIIEGDGKLVCCDEEMELLVPHGLSDEMLNEKHIPVFVKSDTEEGGEIRIGSMPHPMIPEHYIMFAEAIAPDKSHFKLKYLNPGDEPKMLLKHSLDKISAKIYCNLHGLWEAQND